MLKNNLILRACIVLFVLLLTSCGQEPKDIDPNVVIPTPRQVEYQQMEFIGFIHFTINTFTDKEWGYGDESPEIFNPTDFDADQWARAAKHAGHFKFRIIQSLPKRKCHTGCLSAGGCPLFRQVEGEVD